MHVVGSLILSALILGGTGAYTRHVARNVGPVLPPPAQDTVSRVTGTVRDLASRRPSPEAVRAGIRRAVRRSPSGKRGLERLVFQGPSPLPRRKPVTAAVTPPAAVTAPPGTRKAAPATPLRLVKQAEVKPVPDTTASVSGAGADLFSAVNQIVATARQGGIRSKARALLMLSEGLEGMAMAMAQLARDLAEPNMRYPAMVWEPVGKAGAHTKTAGLVCGEAHNAIMAMLNKALGEQLGQVPHHDELNRE